MASKRGDGDAARQGAHRTLSSMSVASLAAGRPFGSGSRQVRTGWLSSGFSFDIFGLRSLYSKIGRCGGDPVITSAIIKPKANMSTFSVMRVFPVPHCSGAKYSCVPLGRVVKWAPLPSLLSYRSRDPKVGQLRLARSREENVIWL